MFGFLIGTLSLFGLVHLFRRSSRGRGQWRRWMTRRLFERLETTPGQERVILNALDEAERAVGDARRTVDQFRSDVSNALRSEHFDGEAFTAAWAKQEATLDEVKKVMKERLQAIHEALDPRQRQTLADLIERGSRPLHGTAGCSRWAHHHGASSVSL